MASGKPDYWSTTYTGLPFPVSGQYMVQEYELQSIAASNDDNLINYEVPAGRILYVTNIHIFSNSLAIIYAYVRVDGDIIDACEFVTTLVLPMNSSSVYQLTAGQVFDILVVNNDQFTKSFSCGMMGFEIAV